MKLGNINPNLHTVVLDNHALTLKSNTEKDYFCQKSSLLHTFLKFCRESKKIYIKLKNILLSFLLVPFCPIKAIIQIRLFSLCYDRANI
jgi:hypothetical protein